MLRVKPITIWMFLLPTFVVIALINLYPIFYTVNYSFTNATFITVGQDTVHNVGFKNYQYVIQHAQDSILPVLGLTILYTVVCIALFLVFGLMTALALNSKLIKGIRVWRLLLVLPWAVPSFITALIWRFLFNNPFGPIDQFITLLNPHGAIEWLNGSGVTAFIAVVIVNLWLSYPFFMVVTLGALQSIPVELNEAATVDGANAWQRFRSITLPLLRPALTPATILSAITTFQMFNTVFLMTGGGPFVSADPNKPGATDFLMIYMYNLYQTNGGNTNFARVATYAVLVFIILLLLLLVGLRTTNVYREAQR